MKNRHVKYFAIVLIVFAQASLLSKQESFLVVKPKPGDGKEKILLRYCLPASAEYLNRFKELNPGKFNRKGEILLNYDYKLPVRIVRTNGRSLKSALGLRDNSLIESVKAYNDKLYVKGLVKIPYLKSKEMLVPMFAMPGFESIQESDEPEPDKAPVRTKETVTKKSRLKKSESIPLFGRNYEDVPLIDRKLEGNVYYLDPGHGGPDPGAIGLRGGRELCEDEYAYDITLRLARNLISHGGKVYVIVRDTTDGIRDGEYLEKDDDEFYIGEYPINEIQKVRLDKRAEIINRLYDDNEPTAKSQQLIVIHLDSRVTKKRIDIFFYNKPECQYSLALARTLCGTVKDCYNKKQPGRGYTGTVSARNLLMLRETKPTSVYIELGNIQNPNDQHRFIQKDNRQAIANWLYQGLAVYNGKKK